MRTIDYALAWILFAVGFVGILVTEIRHPPGAVLDTPFLWILAAMFNLLRLRNGYRVPGLKRFCIAANVIVLMIELMRFKVSGPQDLIQGIPILSETLFSIAGKNDIPTA
jgi:hypothetical protein